MHDAPEHRNRVAHNIGAVVLAFCSERLLAGRPAFHMQELTEYVQAREPSAPASADRILRDLRSKGLVAYEVKDRRASLYELKGVMPDGVGLQRHSKPNRNMTTPPRGDVGGVPRGLFDNDAPRGKALDAIRGR